MAVKDIPQAALDLLACLCEILATPPNTPVCRCVGCLRHSETKPPADMCDCVCTDGETEGNGEAWVRVVRVYPDPQGQFASSAACPGLVAADLELGIYRCIESSIDNDGSLPDCETMANDALMILQDMQALRKAVLCCPEISSMRPQPGEWAPIGPSGKCAGSSIMVTLSTTP